MTDGTPNTDALPAAEDWRWTIRNDAGQLVVAAWGPADGPPPTIIADCATYLADHGMLTGGPTR